MKRNIRFNLKDLSRNNYFSLLWKKKIRKINIIRKTNINVILNNVRAEGIREI